MSDTPILEIRELSVAFPSAAGDTHAVQNISLTLRRGEILGIVGESGSGKSALAAAVMGILPGGGRITGGEILFDGENIWFYNKCWGGHSKRVIHTQHFSYRKQKK